MKSQDVVDLEHVLGRMPKVRRRRNRILCGGATTPFQKARDKMRTVKQILTRAAHAFGAEVMYVPRVRLLDRTSNIHKQIFNFSKECHSDYKEEVLLGIGIWSDRYTHLFKGAGTNRRLKYPEISAAKGAYVAVAFDVKSAARRHSTHKSNQIKVVAFASVRTFHWYNTFSFLKHENKCKQMKKVQCRPDDLFKADYISHIPLGRRAKKGRILELHLVATATDRQNVAKDYGKGLGKIVAMLIVNKMQGVQFHRSGANPEFRYEYLLAEQVVNDLEDKDGGENRYRWEDLFDMVNAVKLEECDANNQDVEFLVKGSSNKFCPKGAFWKKTGTQDGDTVFWGRKRPTTGLEKYFLLSLKQVKKNIIGADLTAQRTKTDACKRYPLGDFPEYINRPKSYLKWYKKARKRTKNIPAEGERQKRDHPNGRKRPHSKGCT